MEFRETLQAIAALEEEHNFLGIRISRREGSTREIETAEEVADGVFRTLQRAADLSRERKSIPKIGE